MTALLPGNSRGDGHEPQLVCDDCVESSDFICLINLTALTVLANLRALKNLTGFGFRKSTQCAQILLYV